MNESVDRYRRTETNIISAWTGSGGGEQEEEEPEEETDDLLPEPMRLIKLVAEGDKFKVVSKLGGIVYVEGRRLDNNNPIFRSGLTANIAPFTLPDGPTIRLLTTEGSTEFVDFTKSQLRQHEEEEEEEEEPEEEEESTCIYSKMILVKVDGSRTETILCAEEI